MENYPKTFIDFIERFHNEDTCREYLLSMRWTSGFKCPKCTHNKYWIGKECSYVVCRSCSRKSYVFAGTVLQDSKISAQIWLVSMWLFATQKDGISAKSLQENLGLNSYKRLVILPLSPRSHVNSSA